MASNYRRKSDSSGSVNNRGSRGRPANSNTRPNRSNQPRTNQSYNSARSTAGSRNATPNARLNSVRIGDLEQAGRAHRVQKSYRRHVVRIMAVLAFLVVAVVGGVFVYNSSLFTVSNVTVKGVEHLTAAEMTELASVPQGTTLLRVDADGIQKRLLEEPWVKEASINRVFPDTLELAITERSIAAIVDVPVNNAQTTETWAISSDGTWLMSIPARDSEKAKTVSSKIYEDADSALHITGVPYGISPQVGGYCNDQNVNNALAIVDGMSTNLSEQVAKVSATGTETTTLILDNGIEIAFGEAKDIRAKERVCLQLMESNPDKIAYINVRVVDKPTWRATS